MYFNMYSVRDELTGTFMQPVFVKTNDEIMRIFQYQVNDIPLWRENASDYTLWKVGQFNEDTGEVIKACEKLATGTSVLKTEEKE